MKITVYLNDKKRKNWGTKKNKKIAFIFCCFFIFISIYILINAQLPFFISNEKLSIGYELNDNFSYLLTKRDLLIKEVKKSVTKAGTVFIYSGTSVPEGFFECNGAEVSRLENPQLFSVIGTTYGEGNGITTFNLPDYRGMFLRGFDSNGEIDPDSNSRIGGNVNGSVQSDQVKGHKHHIPLYWVSRAMNSEGSGQLIFNLDPAYSSGNEFTDLAGGSETRPKNIFVMYIIKSR